MTPNPFLAELAAIDFWVPWRLEFAPPMKKPTKRPYLPSGWPADITDPKSWHSYEEVAALRFGCNEPVAPGIPINQTGFSGIGFVFCAHHPYSGIDLDTDGEPSPEQLRIYSEFNSYSEYSVSGKGVHIIVKGKIPIGKRRDNVEVYSEGRYFTMTGNVLNAVPIQDRQNLLDILYEQMGGDKPSYDVAELWQEAFTDEQIIDMALNAVNGDKFSRLWDGNWQLDYTSQSEADFALYDMLAFYSKHFAQSTRLFRRSALGARDKAKRDDYCRHMFDKSFDNQLPALSNEVLASAMKPIDATASTIGSEPGSSTPSTSSAAAPLALTASSGLIAPLGENVNGKSALPGLLGLISNYIYDAAPRQVRLYADVGAITLLSGICGRSYNVSGTGLNQYMLMLGGTGTGKDAVNSAITRLFTEVQKTCPSIVDFRGAGELVSAPGLAKSFTDKPCQLLIVGEIGKKLYEMVSPYAHSPLRNISRLLLTFYSKSGAGEQTDAMAYSDRANNVAAVNSPSLTLLGESVPDTVYDHMDDTMVADGLLPRFLVFEYDGPRVLFNEHRKQEPSLELVNMIANLAANCHSIAANPNAQALNVPMDPQAAELFKSFDNYSTGVINQVKHTGISEIWNRAHIKALKLAAVAAISDNMYAPLIRYEHAMWATTLVANQTVKLAAKFDLGEIGNVGASESKQVKELCRVIGEFFTSPIDKLAGYGVQHDMWKHGVIAEGYLQRRTACLSCFKNDRLGANAALKRTIEILKRADDIDIMPPQQMLEKYGKKPAAYVVKNPARFGQEIV